jgi:ABC-type branched-subunit amino acid transport system substrate-binding protein
MKKNILLLLLLVCAYTYAQTDTVLVFSVPGTAKQQLKPDTLVTYKIGLILPFQTEATTANLNTFLDASDFFTASHVQLDEDAVTALNFYQGLIMALNERTDSVKLQLYIYDNNNSDSVTNELLKLADVKALNMIIGPVNYQTSKTVAEFCHQRCILNVQPFIPSKSITYNNPYHLKLAPTIDAHIDNMFQSIVDSFEGANIIIYAPDNEIGLTSAKRFDSLFTDYNKTALTKYSHVMINTKTMMVNGKKTTAADWLKPNKKNVWIITSFEESFVNGSFRVMHNELQKYDIITYGMPTWLNGDVMRLDYVNDFQSHISNPFAIDTPSPTVDSFIANYRALYALEPGANAYLGYDVMNFVLRSLQCCGKNFLPQIVTQRYTGLGYTFDITRQMEGATTNYFENSHVNVLKVQDYKVKKYWW